MAEATACVNEETRITLCSIRATKGNPSIFISVGERKLMTHFVVRIAFRLLPFVQLLDEPALIQLGD